MADRRCMHILTAPVLKTTFPSNKTVKKNKNQERYHTIFEKWVLHGYITAGEYISPIKVLPYSDTQFLVLIHISNNEQIGFSY